MHTIGRAQRSEEIVDLLLACHGRIRSFAAMAVAVGERTDLTDDDVVDGCARVQRYFSEALPLHMEDEEDGVLPRLHGRSPELDAALETMSEEHDAHAVLLRQLLALCASLRVDPRDANARAALGPVAKQLLVELEEHLAAEERIVFPAIRELLTSEQQAEMVRELRARRQPP